MKPSKPNLTQTSAWFPASEPQDQQSRSLCGPNPPGDRVPVSEWGVKGCTVWVTNDLPPASTLKIGVDEVGALNQIANLILVGVKVCHQLSRSGEWSLSITKSKRSTVFFGSTFSFGAVLHSAVRSTSSRTQSAARTTKITMSTTTIHFLILCGAYHPGDFLCGRFSMAASRKCAATGHEKFGRLDFV